MGDITSEQKMTSPNKGQSVSSESNDINKSNNSSSYSSYSTDSGQGQAYLKGLKAQDSRQYTSKNSQQGGNKLFQSQDETKDSSSSNSNNRNKNINNNNGYKNNNSAVQSSDSSVNSYMSQQYGQTVTSYMQNEFEELQLAQSVYGGNNDQKDKQMLSQYANSNQFNTEDGISKPEVNQQEQQQQSQKEKPLKNNHLFNSAPNTATGNRLYSQMAQNQLSDSVDHNTNFNEFTHPQFQQITKKSKVIYANRFESSKTTMTQIFNLFSAFGNIVKIIFMHSKSAVLIEYATIENACFAKDYLGDKVFNGNIIKIFYSRYENIFFKDAEEKPIDEEYFEPTEKMNRFKPDAQTAVNPPIDTLHISNLRRESCVFDAIKKAFVPYGAIKNIKFMLEKNNKNMCLVKFDSTSIAMWALANVHNQKLDERPLKISFSKRTLE